ncbi:putative transporter [Duncaniella muricolitica]|jgi:AspT/YidE/YbjL antiporter-like protein|uniref:putative transporter n=1 Tax=Duncaniella muricolitica TaxID=2880704 RepID=UPI00244DB2F1|nr:putative transporter [Duncaniella muricolitica]
MQWLTDLFFSHTALQAVIIISIIIAIGLALGKIRVWGISLGVTFVFFAGILAGHIGLSIDPTILHYTENLGLVLFVYELGLKVGPGFFSSFRKGGLELNMLGLGVMIIGTVMAILCTLLLGVPIGDATGLLCGATTNTPALGAAQQALEQVGLSANGAALSCAVTYPLGVVGVILAIILMRKMFIRPGTPLSSPHDDSDTTFIAEFRVCNPAIYDMTVRQISALAGTKFVISRLWRDDTVSLPESDTVIKKDDHLLVITTPENNERLKVLFGHQEERDWNKKDIDWNSIDNQLVSRRIIVSRPSINGKKLGSLHLRKQYHINISRISRSGLYLLATPELVLQLGDILTVVGSAADIEKVEQTLGNIEIKLKDPNLGAIFLGIVLGLVLGSIPIMVPGISTPIKLGLAGGPIIIGILIGRFGPQFRLVTYTTRSANLMLRGIGLSLYLACLGLEAGSHFIDTIMRPEGLLWILLGFLITIVPVIIMGFVALKICRIDFGLTCGMLCGSMANPMALNYANDIVPGDYATVSYATVYPLSMFCRVIIAQLIILAFI